MIRWVGSSSAGSAPVPARGATRHRYGPRRGATWRNGPERQAAQELPWGECHRDPGILSERHLSRGLHGAVWRSDLRPSCVPEEGDTRRRDAEEGDRGDQGQAQAGGRNPPSDGRRWEEMAAKAFPLYEESTGNVFADLGFPNPAQEQLKAHLSREIHRIIQERKLTQSQAAKTPWHPSIAGLRAAARTPGLLLGRPPDRPSDRARQRHRDRDPRQAGGSPDRPGPRPRKRSGVRPDRRRCKRSGLTDVGMAAAPARP